MGPGAQVLLQGDEVGNTLVCEHSVKSGWLINLHGGIVNLPIDKQVKKVM